MVEFKLLLPFNQKLSIRENSCYITVWSTMTDRAKWFYLLWCTRPYTGLSPFQYSNGLVLILVLLLNPSFHDVPEAGNKDKLFSQQKEFLKINGWDKWQVETCKALAFRNVFFRTRFNSLFLIFNRLHRIVCLFLYQKSHSQFFKNQTSLKILRWWLIRLVWNHAREANPKLV